MMENTQEIIDDFFSFSFESIITEEMFERDYTFPNEKVEEYIMSVISIPYQYYIDYVYSHYCAKQITTSDIPQISSYDLSTRGICQVMKDLNDPGLEYIELGISLLSDGAERNNGAYLKYGENHVKGAAFHGLTHEVYKKWFLTCLGYIYPELDDELRKYLSARTLLRNPFFHIIVAEAVEHDVNIKKYMARLSPSTQGRRSSSCMHFFNVILSQCQLEKVPLHNIYFERNEDSANIQKKLLDISVNPIFFDIEYKSLAPNSTEINPQLLKKIFRYTSTSYKFLWFISILQIFKTSRCLKIDLWDIIVKMVANAWYPTVHHNLSFGKADSLSSIIQDLQEEYFIPSDTDSQTIVRLINYHKADKFITKRLKILEQNVPYRFLSPWIKSDCNDDIVSLSQKYYNGCLYSICRDAEYSYIMINPAWEGYINTHYDDLFNFSYGELTKYLEKKNPHICTISEKLLNPYNNSLPLSHQGAPVLYYNIEEEGQLPKVAEENN